MIRLNGNPYRLCLLDTNAISELSREPALLGRFLVWCQSEEPLYVPCFSPFTLIEIRRSTKVYEKFVEIFASVPCILLKGYEQLLEEEVLNYPDPSQISPVLTAFVGLRSLPGNQLEDWLSAAFGDTAVLTQEQVWNSGQEAIVSGIRTLVDNYPSVGSSYTAKELRGFVQLTGFEQIARRAPDFSQRTLSTGKPVDIDAFPSIKASSHTVFYKFYVDRTRTPSRSDAFDIIISTAAPYVDAIVTENHQAEVLRKTARQDGYIQHLRILTLKDLRQMP